MSWLEDAYLAHLHQRLGVGPPELPEEAPYLDWMSWPADRLLPKACELDGRARSAILKAAQEQREDAKKHPGTKVFGTVGEFVAFDLFTWLMVPRAGKRSADALLRFFGHPVPDTSAGETLYPIAIPTVERDEAAGYHPLKGVELYAWYDEAVHPTSEPKARLTTYTFNRLEGFDLRTPHPGRKQYRSRAEAMAALRAAIGLPPVGRS